MLEYSAFQQKCIAILEEVEPSHGQQCFRSAFLHLEKAHRILEMDPAMAAFRAITAEEEAASGLMRCLRDLNYPGAERLNPHHHTHKHAVFPFINIIGLFFSECSDTLPEARLRLMEKEGCARLVIELLLPNGLSAVSEMPLHFAVTDQATGSLISYDSQIKRFEVSQQIDSVQEFLRDEANRRNTILYASPSGVPVVELEGDAFIVERQRRVIVMLYAYLMIQPYSAHQEFISHSLREFLTLLDQLKRRQCQKKSA